MSKAKFTSSTKVHQLSRGHYATILPVPPFLVDQVRSVLPDPEVPTVKDPETGIVDQNPLDPQYIAALKDVAARREELAIDAIIESSVTLCDENGVPLEDVPQDRQFFRMMKRIGVALDDDPEARMFQYIKLWALGTEDMKLVMEASGLGSYVQQAEATFQH